jgi:hypothetical protein
VPLAPASVKRSYLQIRSNAHFIMETLSSDGSYGWTLCVMGQNLGFIAGALNWAVGERRGWQSTTVDSCAPCIGLA